MRKLCTLIVLFSLAVTLAAGPVWAKSHKFKLTREGSINGTTLDPGTYQLKLNGDDEAVISQNGKVVVKAPAEVKQRSNGRTASSVLRAADGSIREIRFDDVVVVLRR